jgi:hypothetical protein
VGDQYYEHRPTTRERGPEPTLDVLYRWYLWLWAFRDLTRSVPTVVLVDDHDVYHPNLWGNAGAPPPAATTARAGTSTRPPGSTWSSASRPATTPTPMTRPRLPRHRRLLRRLPLQGLRAGRGPQVQERRQGQP